jgi:catechol 2,3-dioxygenase-like lactoylglutathione lyase family enzyme
LRKTRHCSVQRQHRTHVVQPRQAYRRHPVAIKELGHTGLWVYDLAQMRDFYERVVGLIVTDDDPELGIVFFSARPDVEHHEFVLQKGRTSAIDARQQHQISWRVSSLKDILEYHRRFEREGVRVQQEVTHGNAIGIYFFDPEGNRNEVYLRIDKKVRQPFRKTLNLNQSPVRILAEADRLLTDDGPAYQPVDEAASPPDSE